MKKLFFLLMILAQFGYAQQLRKPGDNVALPVEAGKGQPDADLEKIRKRILDDLLEPPVRVQQIAALINTQKQDGTWPDINYTDVSRTGFEHSEHLKNMLELARAFKKPGSAFLHKAEVKKAVSNALDFWLVHDFICENWWWNEMGTPQLMINILLVMDEELTENQKKEGVRIAGRANLEASGARPGGDLIQIAGMRGKQALFQRNPEVLGHVMEVMVSEIKVSTGRGLKPDLSFHHRTDNVISTLAYGTGYANAFAYWAVKTEGTKYRLPDEPMKLLVDYFLDGVCQSHAFGKYPDPGAENRGITRKGALKPAGPELAENLLAATSYRKAELENIIRIRKGEAKPNLRKDYYFWHSHYYTHQRPGYYASVRMHSKRAANMEQPHNEEGLKSHHYGDGSNFITRTGHEYDQIFPVWDWQKVPGTTVLQKPELPHWKELAKQGINAFTGGVTDQRYGAAAFDFASVHDPLKAKKAWFFFDKEYVALGAGVTSNAEYNVVTTLNQSLLSGQVSAGVGGKTLTLEKGAHKLDKASWLHHDSTAYIFTEPLRLDVSNQQQTGSWRQINHHTWATDEKINKDVFKAWLDHGSKPTDAGYNYIVVPGIGATEISTYRQRLPVQVIANSSQMQAVRHIGLGVVQIVFYEPGTIQLTEGLSVKAKEACMVMLQLTANQIAKITLSDPAGNHAQLHLEVSGNLKAVSDHVQLSNAGMGRTLLPFRCRMAEWPDKA
ncbi:polysaccharide lyase family 8 super-sandwich domain-containing protein [Dyadobacter chenhuakuii]|uniref:Polysaccharide lyase beta-sandwich domain-containing protein n=1 Tax=Dyadobacter chenhuakuii TaxID=2909339 RepID=A0ABY4XLK6_9BACT|nr:polysaccharide lyase family 8 super-sandwich domain-containing protein [Dyadobacter chenhuakuii]MCF2494145.1 polysaccharide lyase beta-sandwich domain-containing protein [Dyadobacter chenhuakuii]USJ31273.1 polysaccharide lyase beta-sandwich domain-containing protein [Dyadobacter chenhuakuii]